LFLLLPFSSACFSSLSFVLLFRLTFYLLPSPSRHVLSLFLLLPLCSLIHVLRIIICFLFKLFLLHFHLSSFSTPFIQFIPYSTFSAIYFASQILSLNFPLEFAWPTQFKFQYVRHLGERRDTTLGSIPVPVLLCCALFSWYRKCRFFFSFQTQIRLLRHPHSVWLSDSLRSETMYISCVFCVWYSYCV
jgi:hypothetical protein